MRLKQPTLLDLIKRAETPGQGSPPPPPGSVFRSLEHQPPETFATPQLQGPHEEVAGRPAAPGSVFRSSDHQAPKTFAPPQLQGQPEEVAGRPEPGQDQETVPVQDQKTRTEASTNLPPPNPPLPNLPHSSPAHPTPPSPGGEPKTSPGQDQGKVPGQEQKTTSEDGTTAFRPTSQPTQHNQPNSPKPTHPTQL